MISFPKWSEQSDAFEIPLNFSLEDISDKGTDIGLQLSEVPKPKIFLQRDHLDCVNINQITEHPLLNDFVKVQMVNYDFRLIRIPCSIQPEGKSKIIYLRLSVTFGESNKRHPLLHSIFPQELSIPAIEKTEVGIDPSLEIKNVADLKIGKLVKTIEINRFCPGIKGYYSENKAEWELFPTDNNGIWGIKEFFILVKWPKPAYPVPVSVSVFARVQVSTFGIVTGSKSYSYSSYDPRLCTCDS